MAYRVVGYHATTLDNWPSISRYGLIPGKSDPAGQDWKARWSGKAIYYHLDFPFHELDNGYDPDSGEPLALVIEVDIHACSHYFVPDEEVGEPENTCQVIKDKGAVAVGYSMPPARFIAIHLADTEESRAWAAKNIKPRFKVQFHKVY